MRTPFSELLINNYETTVVIKQMITTTFQTRITFDSDAIDRTICNTNCFDDDMATSWFTICWKREWNVCFFWLKRSIDFVLKFMGSERIESHWMWLDWIVSDRIESFRTQSALNGSDRNIGSDQKSSNSADFLTSTVRKDPNLKQSSQKMKHLSSNSNNLRKNLIYSSKLRNKQQCLFCIFTEFVSFASWPNLCLLHQRESWILSIEPSF